MVKKRISELENKIMKIIQDEEQREKRLKNMKLKPFR